jgi:hypothetical protein
MPTVITAISLTLTSRNATLATAASAFDILVEAIPSGENPPLNGTIPNPYGYAVIWDATDYNIVASFMWQAQVTS